MPGILNDSTAPRTRGELKRRAELDRRRRQLELQAAVRGMPPTEVIGPRPKWAHPDLRSAGMASGVPNPGTQDLGFALQDVPLGLAQKTGSTLEQMGLGNEVTTPDILLSAAEMGLNLFDLGALGTTGVARNMGRNLLRQNPFLGERVPFYHYSPRARAGILSPSEAGTGPVRGAERNRAGAEPSVHGFVTGGQARPEPYGRYVSHGVGRKILDEGSKTGKKIKAEVRDELQKLADAEARRGGYAAHVSQDELATAFEQEVQRRGYRGIKHTSEQLGDVVKIFEDRPILRTGEVPPELYGPAARRTPGRVAQYAANQPGGFSINPATGEVPTSGVAVARRGSERVVPGPATPADIERQLVETPPGPGEYAGGWSSGDKTYLDTSRVFPPSPGNLPARVAGEKNWQLAAYDIGNERDINMLGRPFVEDLPRVAGLVSDHPLIRPLSPFMPKFTADIVPEKMRQAGQAAGSSTRAPFPQFATRYPPVPPMEARVDKATGKAFKGRGSSPTTKRFMAERAKIQKDIEAGNYTPFFDPALRYDAPSARYPMRADTRTEGWPKKPETIAKWREKIQTDDARQRLQEAYDAGIKAGYHDRWYMMGQLEEEFIKELGPEAGQKAFRERFSDAMAATTGGVDPQANLVSAAYGNYLRTHGKPIPKTAARAPVPTKGKYLAGNLKLHDEFTRQGRPLGVGHPKRHNFSANFEGHREVSTVDEQMTDLITPGVKAPPGGTYGIYEELIAEMARKNNVDPRDFQDIAWGGKKQMKGRGYSGKSMIEHVNEAIERTSRLTGMPRDQVLKRGLIRGEIPVYGLTGVAVTGLLSPGEVDEVLY